MPDRRQRADDRVARLRQLVAEIPDVGLRLMWQFAEDERRLHNRVMMLGRGTAEERMAAFLFDLWQRLRRLGLIKGEGTFRLPMTHREIADHLGLHTVHVSRILARFRRRGMVMVKAGVATIDNIAMLARLAAPVQDIFERFVPDFEDTAADQATPTSELGAALAYHRLFPEPRHLDRL